MAVRSALRFRISECASLFAVGPMSSPPRSIMTADRLRHDVGRAARRHLRERISLGNSAKHGQVFRIYLQRCGWGART